MIQEGTDPPESANIEVPIGDPFFDPDGTGTEVIELNRSIYNESSIGTSILAVGSIRGSRY